MGIECSGQVSLNWLLNILSTLDPGHEFFSKGFVPVKTLPKKVECVDNADGFFDGLPDTKRKRIIK